MHKKRVIEVDFGLLSKERTLVSYRNGFIKTGAVCGPI